jgi:hypothetical protein
MASRNDPQSCPSCGSSGERQVTAAYFNGASDWNTQSWNPGLGCYTKSHKEAEKIAKSRGLEPIGNENPDNIHKHYEKQREETKERRWQEAAKVGLFD